MKIKNIVIKRFRSIFELELKIDVCNNYISICGQNNTGKTNVLRAIRLFFNPNLYSADEDSPYHKFYITRGGSVFPLIEITFEHTDGNDYTIERKFDLNGLSSTTGFLMPRGRKRGKTDLSLKKCLEIIKSIKFYYVESVNISIPDLINDLTDDLFDVEYEHSVFRGAKAELKNAFDKYIDGLNEILGELADEITPMFHEFKDNWDISFSLDSDVKKFRDLISADISFDILDGSNNAIDSKGAGLQRLAYILLHIRIIEKMKRNDVIFLIDEPDVYIHAGMQKILYHYLKSMNSNVQTLVTTHSKIFIDTYKLSNVFLLELAIDEMYSERRKKQVKILKTTLVKFNEDTGVEKIKQYLGIEDHGDEVLQAYNIIVEGDSDKKYLSELIKFFGFDIPNIISINGANNLPMYLNYYDSQYSKSERKPKILVLLDNDIKGREVGKKEWSNIKKSKYQNLICSFSYMPNFNGDIQDKEKLDGVQTNHEVEDLLYPEIMVYLINILLRKKGMNLISNSSVTSKIVKPAFGYKGILDLCENEKNQANPDDGNQLVFTLSNKATDNIKTTLANMFNVESDFKVITMLEQCNIKYPQVKGCIKKIVDNDL